MLTERGIVDLVSFVKNANGSLKTGLSRMQEEEELSILLMVGSLLGVGFLFFSFLRRCLNR